MPRKGYWVECIPLHGNANQNMSPDLYGASIRALPEVSAYAPSPDKAIEKLRAKLKKLKQYYELTGRTMPDSESPAEPPSRLKFVEGWMSVYVDMIDESQGRA
ncbi:MAG: hypothetical protein GC136_08355 [Alphaproteobacteria bacterium]|nr:hypothetical protein [Alphaproteobacteria bacterium]